jgi:hypothetical protein
VVLRVHVRAGLEQAPDDVEVRCKGCVVQRGAAVLVALVEERLGSHREVEGFAVARANRLMERAERAALAPSRAGASSHEPSGDVEADDREREDAIEVRSARGDEALDRRELRAPDEGVVERVLRRTLCEEQLGHFGMGQARRQRRWGAVDGCAAREQKRHDVDVSARRRALERGHRELRARRRSVEVRATVRRGAVVEQERERGRMGRVIERGLAEGVMGVDVCAPLEKQSQDLFCAVPVAQEGRDDEGRGPVHIAVIDGEPAREQELDDRALVKSRRDVKESVACPTRHRPRRLGNLTYVRRPQRVCGRRCPHIEQPRHALGVPIRAGDAEEGPAAIVGVVSRARVDPLEDREVAGFGRFEALASRRAGQRGWRRHGRCARRRVPAGRERCREVEIHPPDAELLGGREREVERAVAHASEVDHLDEVAQRGCSEHRLATTHLRAQRGLDRCSEVRSVWSVLAPRRVSDVLLERSDERVQAANDLLVTAPEGRGCEQEVSSEHARIALEKVPVGHWRRSLLVAPLGIRIGFPGGSTARGSAIRSARPVHTRVRSRSWRSTSRRSTRGCQRFP